jgi:hypothetical protein
MAVTPFIKPIKTQGGTFYIMPSTAEDMSFAYGDDSRVMRFSKYALLNIPKILDNSADNNTIQLDAIPGAYLQVTGSDWNKYLSESFQNYLLNIETLLTSKEDYNQANNRTVSERLFWKWMKEIGALRFREANTTEVSNLTTGQRFVEEDTSDGTTTGGIQYNRVVKYIGEIDVVNSVRHVANTFTEFFCHIPTKDGNSPVVLFKSVSDDNYYPDMFIQNTPSDPLKNEYIVGRGPNDTQPYGLNFFGFFDSDTGSYSNTDYTLEKYNSSTDTWDSGYWYPSPQANSYFTEPTRFDDWRNDTLRITGVNIDTGKFTPVTYLRSRLDGIMVDFDLNSYLAAVQDSRVNSWHQFNATEASSSFEFNAVLIYYETFPKGFPEQAETNLFGVLFLDNVDPTDDGGGKIPTLTKIKPDSILGINGTSFNISVRLRFDVNTEDAAIETSVNDYSTFSLEVYVGAMNEMIRASRTLQSSVMELGTLKSRVEDLEQSIINSTVEEEILARLSAVENSLQSSDALIRDTQSIIGLIDRNYQQFQDLINNTTSINVSYNADVLYSEPRVDGIEVDRTVVNRVRLKNTFGSYNLTSKPITNMEQDWLKGTDSWNYTYTLEPGNNYLRIETNTILNSDRNIVLFVDDTINKWKRGQSMKVSFGGAGVDVDNTFGVFRFFVLTDAQNVMQMANPYSVQAASILSGEFENANGKPMFEIICVSTNPLQFSAERLR